MSQIISLSGNDIDAIISHEKACWPCIGAGKETILNRFDLGHRMLGVKDGSEIIGLLAFSYANFDPKDRDSFPKTFREFSSIPRPDRPNAFFAYSFAVVQNEGGTHAAHDLIDEITRIAGEENIQYLVGDGRCPSYNGYDQEKCKTRQGSVRSEAFRKVIDEYERTDEFPDSKEFRKDSTLRLYEQMTQCKFLWIMRDFSPEDYPSGGYRVILYKNMSENKQTTKK